MNFELSLVGSCISKFLSKCFLGWYYCDCSFGERYGFKCLFTICECVVEHIGICCTICL